MFNTHLVLLCCKCFMLNNKMMKFYLSLHIHCLIFIEVEEVICYLLRSTCDRKRTFPIASFLLGRELSVDRTPSKCVLVLIVIVVLTIELTL